MRLHLVLFSKCALVAVMAAGCKDKSTSTSTSTGADPSAIAMDVESIYYRLITENNLQGLKKAFENSHHLCGVKPYGKSFLIHAIINNKIQIIKYLISKGCDLNEGDIDRGVTPLQAAALKNNTEAARILLTENAIVDSEDKFGNTPLIEAIFVYEGDITMTTLLLTSGANPNHSNKAGVSPFELAKTTKKIEIIKLFEINILNH